MRANQSTDVIDLNLAFKLRNLFLNQRRDRLGILAARRLRHDALTRIICTVLYVCHHGLSHLGNRSLLSANLLTWRQLTFAIDRHKRANLERRADDRARGRNATAAQVARQIGREEPVVQVEFMLLDPSGRLVE